MLTFGHKQHSDTVTFNTDTHATHSDFWRQRTPCNMIKIQI